MGLLRGKGDIRHRLGDESGYGVDLGERAVVRGLERQPAVDRIDRTARRPRVDGGPVARSERPAVDDMVTAAPALAGVLGDAAREQLVVERVAQEVLLVDIERADGDRVGHRAREPVDQRDVVEVALREAVEVDPNAERVLESPRRAAEDRRLLELGKLKAIARLRTGCCPAAQVELALAEYPGLADGVVLVPVIPADQARVGDCVAGVGLAERGEVVA